MNPTHNVGFVRRKTASAAYCVAVCCVISTSSLALLGKRATKILEAFYDSLFWIVGKIDPDLEL